MKLSEIIQSLNNKWITPIITIITAIYGLIFGFYFNKIDVQEKKLKQIETEVNTKIKEKEFINNIRMSLYQEVKDAIKNKDTQLQKVTLILVDELLREDTTFRNKLVTVMLAGSETKSLMKAQDDLVHARELETNTTDSWMITVFYLEDIIEESKPRADKIYEMIKNRYPKIMVYLKPLPKIVNSKENYRISQNMIRVNPNNEEFAKRLMNWVNNGNIFPLEKVILTTNGNMDNKTISIFVRNM